MRQDNTTVFWNRPWLDYKNGFNSGADLKNSWLGLDRIYALTNKDPQVTMRIELWGNRCQQGDRGQCGGIGHIGPDGYWYGDWPFRVIFAVIH